jgi:hypothetical protein
MKLYNIFAATAITCYATASLAAIDMATVKDNMFVAVDVGRIQTPLKSGYGRDFFASHAVEGSLSFGSKFCNCFGFELGYTQQFREKKTVVRRPGETLFPGANINIPANEDAELRAASKARHPFVLFTANRSFWREELSLGLGLGFSVSKIKMWNFVYSVNGQQLSSAQKTSSIRTFEKTRVVPMLRVNAAYALSDVLQLRAGATWRQLSRFKRIKAKEGAYAAGVTPAISLRDAYSFTLGVVYSFC